MKLLSKVRFLFLLIFSLLVVSGLGANISKSFQDSLPYKNSGGYVWSVWDYMTNPYLYSLYQKDAISFRFTNNQRFSLGGSQVVFGWPVYLAFEFSDRGSTGSQYRPLFTSDQRDVSEVNNLDFRVIAGTIVYKNLGVGAYFLKRNSFRHYSPIRLELGTGPGSVTLRNVNQVREISEVGSPLRDFGFTAVGIEFGQFSGGRDVVQGEAYKTDSKFSYTVSLGYKKYGTVQQENQLTQNPNEVIRNDAPLLELNTDNLNFQRVGNKVYFGTLREEYNANLLSWYTLADFANVGISTEIQIAPKLTGTDNSFASKVAEPVDISVPVSVESYKVFFETFTNLDIRLTWKGNQWGTLRFSPAVQFSYQTEKARFGAPINGKIDNQEYFVQLSTPAQFYFYLNESKSFVLIAGWRPAFNLTHELFQKIYDFEGITELEPCANSCSYKLQRAPLEDQGTLTENIYLGVMYAHSSSLTFHVGFGKLDGIFNLDQMEFGINYSWGVGLGKRGNQEK